MNHDHQHHPRHRFDPAKARNLLRPERRLIHEPMELLRAMGVTPGLRLGDFGCGPGFFTAPLLEVAGDQGGVTALDDEPAMLDLLRGHVPPSARLRVVRGDATRTGLEAESLDGILFAFTLHEVQTRPALMEASRLLTPGGRVWALEWGGGPCPDRGDGQPAGPPMDHRLLEEKLTALLESAGFTVEARGQRLDGCQYWLRAGKGHSTQKIH